MVAKKDWKEAKKKYEEQDKQNDKSPESSTRDSPNVSEDNDPESGDYQKEMDEMRCILYCHGGTRHSTAYITCTHGSYAGGYYFGSVDQER